MAVRVVVVLEVIDVEHDEGHRVAGRLRAIQLELEALAKEAEVVELRERVGDRAVRLRTRSVCCQKRSSMRSGRLLRSWRKESIESLRIAQALSDRTVADRAPPSRPTISPITAPGPSVRSTTRPSPSEVS